MKPVWQYAVLAIVLACVYHVAAKGEEKQATVVDAGVTEASNPVSLLEVDAGIQAGGAELTREVRQFGYGRPYYGGGFYRPYYRPPIYGGYYRPRPYYRPPRYGFYGGFYG